MKSIEEVSRSFLTRLNIGDDTRYKIRKFLDDNKSESPFEFFENLADKFKNNYRAIIIELDNSEGAFFSPSEIHRLNPHIGQAFGELLTQNDLGEKVISVHDRDRLGTMWQGARYHQTREGGSIHTDNVNIPDPWDFLYMSCISQALVGGESILVDGFRIQQKLKDSFPKALKTLEDSFIWEMRGVANELYKAPIITYNDLGEPLFRYLRPYMLSAHQKAQQSLTNEQLYAIDVLDALTNSSEFQFRYRMKKGDILITKDAQVLHGRTCFSDAIEAVSLDEFEKGKGQVLKRTMERLWIKNH